MQTILAAAVIATGLAVPGAAGVPEVCGAHDTLTTYLSERYRERLRAQKIGEDGVHYELFISPENTWTILGTKDGMTCVVATGTGRAPGVEV